MRVDGNEGRLEIYHNIERVNDFEDEYSHDGMTHKIKLDILSFDSTYGPKFNMDHLFGWFGMSEARPVCFAKIKCIVCPLSRVLKNALCVRIGVFAIQSGENEECG